MYAGQSDLDPEDEYEIVFIPHDAGQSTEFVTFSKFVQFIPHVCGSIEWLQVVLAGHFVLSACMRVNR